MEGAPQRARVTAKVVLIFGEWTGLVVEKILRPHISREYRAANDEASNLALVRHVMAFLRRICGGRFSGHLIVRAEQLDIASILDFDHTWPILREAAYYALQSPTFRDVRALLRDWNEDLVPDDDMAELRVFSFYVAAAWKLRCEIVHRSEASVTIPLRSLDLRVQGDHLTCHNDVIGKIPAADPGHPNQFRRVILHSNQDNFNELAAIQLHRLHTAPDVRILLVDAVPKTLLVCFKAFVACLLTRDRTPWM